MAHILIVEDDHDLAVTWRIALTDEGHDTWICANGNEARRALAARQPDLIICDIFMPQERGISFIGKSKLHHPDLKFIAVTGQVPGAYSVDALKTARQLGADETLRKPVGIATLIDTCIGVLNGARSPSP